MGESILGLTLLNTALRRLSGGFTYICSGGRSVVDIVMVNTIGQPSLTIQESPTSTPHQLLVAIVLDSADDPGRQPDRWNWACRLFADPEAAKLIQIRHQPAMMSISAFWKSVGDYLDDQLESEDPEIEIDATAQHAVDCANEFMCQTPRSGVLVAHDGPARIPTSGACQLEGSREDAVKLFHLESEVVTREPEKNGG
jgi:hypothetical protein